MDCRTKEVDRREIYIVEGDSALGACKQSRDAEFQGLMPVRGKILNCLKADYPRIFKSDVITDLMKVLGCDMGNIRNMFLIESGTIGFIGGVIGCLFSVLISFVLNNFTVWMQAITGWLMSIGVQVNFDASSFDVGALFGMGGMGGIGNISDIPAWLLLMALIFATVVGLLSGIAPANRAVKISALEAIRHE